MPPPQMRLPDARAMRILHAALTLGLSLGAVVFVVVRRVTPLPALPQGPTIGIAFAVAAIGALAVALAVVRPRVPPQAPGQSRDVYWGDMAVRGTAILTWAVAEGAGLLAAVGYLLTGTMASGLVLVLAIVTLAYLRPARFEQDE